MWTEGPTKRSALPGGKQILEEHEKDANAQSHNDRYQAYMDLEHRKPRHLAFSMILRRLTGAVALFSCTISAQAGGWDGGGGTDTVDVLLLMTLSLAGFIFVPITATKGEYLYGAFSMWQVPIIILIVGAGFFLLQLRKGGKRLLVLPLLYALPVVFTNVWAVTHPVDRWSNFPVDEILSKIDWHNPPTADELIAATGKPDFRAEVAINDLEIPVGLKDSLDRHSLSDALVLVFIETRSGATLSSYLIFSKTTGNYVSRLKYRDWYKDPAPNRWPKFPSKIGTATTAAPPI